MRGLLTLLVVFLSIASGAQAAEPPAGTTWTETYLDTPDGERLHADVLRPTAAGDAKTPVILVVSPYLGLEEPVTGAPGPSSRFYDFFEGAKVFERGYSVVMVSTRGTGGSSGCLDILGPGEQTDVVTAVKWAASQPWSTGKVGMYGKSYDANTGVVGATLRPEGLAAVVAQQIVPDRYRGSYSGRVRLFQSLAYPSVSYGSGGEGTFSLQSDPEYIVNSVSRSADCQALLAGHYDERRNARFWRVRDFARRARGSKVPTFITAGYLDVNTNIGGGTTDFFNALRGPKRMWLGWWDHVRGAELSGERLAMGRPGFYDEVMRFYDQYVKGEDTATEADPVIAAQSSDGTWREETRWPPRGVKPTRFDIAEGAYADDGANEGSGDSAAGAGGAGTGGGELGHGSWTYSEPFDHAVQVAGDPVARVEVAPQVARTNLVVNVYDVAPGGAATMITRGARLVDRKGASRVELFPTDWVVEAGHRIGVLISGANAEAYTHVPTNTTVFIDGGWVKLPLLQTPRTPDLEGGSNPRLERYLADAPFQGT